jgi:hypothetical protein
MKMLFVLVVPVMMLCAAEPPARKAANVASPTTAAKRIEIPAGAVEFEPGAYRFTDKAGKKWIYRKTPFGIGRYEDAPEPARTAAPKPDYSDVKATEAGDVIRFERRTPFGVSKWETRKTELDEMESAVWERAQTAQK